MILNKILGIVSIVYKNLYSIRYDDGYESAFDRLMDIWHDVEYVHEYFESNHLSFYTEYWSNKNWKDVRDSIPDHASNLEELIYELSESNNPNITLDDFFEPLENFETTRKIFQLSKGKNQQWPKCLRIYALRLGPGRYVITGGAIKLTNYMNDHIDTKIELKKLRVVSEYLRDVIGDD